jgi:rhomboid protease GluP
VLGGVWALVHLVLVTLPAWRGARDWSDAIARPPRAFLLVRAGALKATRLDHGELWRLGSALFLHGGWLHLLANLIAVASVGPAAEAVLGLEVALLDFVLGGATGNLASWTAGTPLSVGASGGLFAWLGALLVVGFRDRDRLGSVIGPALRRRILPWLLLNLALGALLPVDDQRAHIGGLLGGLVLGAVLGAEHPPAPRRRRRAGAFAGALLLLAALGAAQSWSRPLPPPPPSAPRRGSPG